MMGTSSEPLTSMGTSADHPTDDGGRSQPAFPGHTVAHIVIFLVMVSASFIGIVANACVFIMFRKCKKLHSTTNLLVEVLSYLDFTMAVVGLPITGISALQERFVASQPAVIGTGFAMTYLGLSNINILTAIAVERYICIVHPHRKIRTPPSVTVHGIIACLGMPLIWSIAPLCGWNHYALEGTMISASVNWVVKNPAEIAYISLMLFINFFIPLVLISNSYIAIIRQIRSVARNSAWGRNHYLTRKNIRMEIEVAKTTAAVIVSFLAAWFPYAIVSCMTVIQGQGPLHPIAGTIPAVLAKCSCAINPVVYVATNAQFQREFVKIIRGTGANPVATPTLQGDTAGETVVAEEIEMIVNGDSPPGQQRGVCDKDNG